MMRPGSSILPAIALATGALLTAGTLPLSGQEASVLPRTALPGAEVAAGPVQSPANREEDGSFLGLAKWGTLGLSIGASAYGFHVNGQADDQFQEIQAICTSAPERCETRASDGSFADEELEARYQEVLDKDRNARAALILAQVGLAATIVLFVLDLDGGETPPDIPFDPPKLSFSPDRTEVSWSVALPFH